MEYDDIVELFLDIYINSIKKEIEVPSINFIFGEDSFSLFKRIMNRPLALIHQKEYEEITGAPDKKCLSIRVNDYDLFFKLLTSIVNETTKLSEECDKRISIMPLLRRIWLRMGINDVENVEQFLHKQLEFYADRTFDLDKDELVTNYKNCNVYRRTTINETWDESTRSMEFLMVSMDGMYELPRVLYDIDKDGNCYIFGVQNSNRYKSKSKKIERIIYKLNDGIQNPNVHPNKVLSLLLFIEQLESKGISRIIVPSMQVLSYRYHELLSEEAASCKEADTSFYERFYDKQDLISRLKTEDLIYLMYRITEHNPNIEIINEVSLQGDCLIMENKRIKT